MRTDDLKHSIAALEATGNYRVLKRLRSHTICDLRISSATRLGLFLDTETTGTDHVADEIIELAMVPFTLQPRRRHPGRGCAIQRL